MLPNEEDRTMQKHVFVLMPFGDKDEYQGGSLESNYVYDEIIAPGVQMALGENCVLTREVDKRHSGSITDSIVRHLATADVVIVDITGWNPNVFLELGIRYALRNKITIILAQGGTELPFDIAGYRAIFYQRFAPSDARKTISEFITFGFSDKLISDSVVFGTFRNLSVKIPGEFESRGETLMHERVVMSWDEYMGRIAQVAEWLRPLVNEGLYVPHAVLGISNGGMVVADLIGKAVFAGKNTPILGLWAQRYTRNDDYFDNRYNEGVLNVLKAENRQGMALSVLLLDDHFGSGNTSKQAVEYLKKILGAETQILFIPLVSRRAEYTAGMEEFLPYRYELGGQHTFGVSKEEFLRFLDTRANYFPYLHKQVSEGLEHIVE